MPAARFDLSRGQILAFRRRTASLDERLPPGKRSLRRAAWAGLQDSMPRSAVLSIHARVRGVQPNTWEDPSLVQLWGPRYSTYVVAAADRAIFTLSRLSDEVDGLRRAEDLASRLHQLLDGEPVLEGHAGKALGVHPNALRYAAPTGTLLIRWDGARQPLIWTVPRPDIPPQTALRELARRYLHVFGPATPESFARWAGIHPHRGVAAFRSISRSLLPVTTPIGDGWILTRDEPELRANAGPEAPARLLPSGDTYFLLQGADRELLVSDAGRRGELWTSRVWPGALLVDGEIVGTWRRSQEKVSIKTWRRMSAAERGAVEAETASLPIPGIEGKPITVRWMR